MKNRSGNDSLSSACTVTTAELSCSTNHSQSSTLGEGKRRSLGSFAEEDDSSGFLVLRRSDVSWKAPMRLKRDNDNQCSQEKKRSEECSDDYADTATVTTCSWDEGSSHNPSEEFVFRNSSGHSPHSVKKSHKTKSSKLVLQPRIRNSPCESPQTLATNRWDDSVSPDASKSTVSTLSRSAGSAAKKKLRVKVKASELAQLGLSPGALKAAQGTAESDKVQATLKKWLETKKCSDTTESLEGTDESNDHRGRRASLDSATDRTKDRSKSLGRRNSASVEEESKRAQVKDPSLKERSRSSARQVAHDVVSRQRSRSCRRRSNEGDADDTRAAEKESNGIVEPQTRRSRSCSRRSGNSADDEESKSSTEQRVETQKELPSQLRSRSTRRTSSNKDETSSAIPRTTNNEIHTQRPSSGSSLHRRSKSQSRKSTEEAGPSNLPDNEVDKETRTRSRSTVARRPGRLERHRSKSRARRPEDRSAPTRSLSSVLRDVGISEEQLAKLQASGLVISKQI